jgi:PA14 domain
MGDEIVVPIRSRATLDVTLPKPLPGAMDAKIPDAERRGRDAIVVDEWGPYDWKSPKLWPDDRSDRTPLTLRVLGPAGEWTSASVRGAAIEPASGKVPGTIVVTPGKGSIVDYDVRLVYRGAAVTGPRGDAVSAGAPYTFGYSRFFVPIDWHVRYFAFDEASRPDKLADAFSRITSGTPIKTDTRDRLDYMSGRAIAEGVPADRVALTAEGDVELPAGGYTLRTISDDGVRVYVDGTRVIDRWTEHESALDAAPLSAGRHHLRVEYFELTGFAELRVEILKRP